jgi:hypothetical protein
MEVKKIIQHKLSLI